MNATKNNCMNFNGILDREMLAGKIKQILLDFTKNKSDLSVKRGIYVYGHSGCGKTEFVTRILNEMKYDIIRYDAGDIRNKSVIDTITKHNMSDQSVMSIFEQTPRKLVIVMDEIDGMNTGDKGGITSLIKLIRPKKTKKQKMEDYTTNPIICIGNYEMDKKIKEIMKVCHTIELLAPTHPQMRRLVDALMPDLIHNNAALGDKIAAFVQSDIRKLITIYNLRIKNKSIIDDTVLDTIFRAKDCSENSKKITSHLFNGHHSIGEHASLISETDRTIIGLLWHENVINMIANKPSEFIFYETVLKNVCFADYIDRITFQKQIWIFNEMSSLIKTFYNNALYHSFKNESLSPIVVPAPSISAADIRFTKVLTKYSTEYNNSIFIQRLCNQMLMDQKDLIEFFKDLKNTNNKSNDTAVGAIFEQYEITKLDMDRLYRYIDKFSEDVMVAAASAGGNSTVDSNCVGHSSHSNYSNKSIVSGSRYKKKRVTGGGGVGCGGGGGGGGSGGYEDYDSDDIEINDIENDIVSD